MNIDPHVEQTARTPATPALPNGARFYRCALQVNPFTYLGRHDKPTAYTSEDRYNEAIIETCRKLCIEVIAVTDHYRIRESISLVQAAREAGLFALPAKRVKAARRSHLNIWDQSTRDRCGSWSKRSSKAVRRRSRCAVPSTDSDP